MPLFIFDYNAFSFQLPQQQIGVSAHIPKTNDIDTLGFGRIIVNHLKASKQMSTSIPSTLSPKQWLWWV